jgi:hypothetical protein
MVCNISLASLQFLKVPRPQLCDTLCWNAKYHNEAFIRRFNKTLSINWPYKPEDVLIQITSKFAINPVFVRYLQNLDHWTVGPDFIEL